ncbi:MAG: carboxypeptidase-like regulatory domain-containing protein [Myxococcales bacterium]|nr:carboxypeptidase-like regulatory domain-containing protein [Myxococcales bacterium]
MLIYALAIALLGCSGNEPPSFEDSGPFEVALQPAELTIAAGASGTSEVSVVFTDIDPTDVTWDWVGAPEGITASITATSVTVAVDPQLAPSTYQGWVRATAGDDRVAEPIVIRVIEGEVRDVAGRVVDAFGRPAVGLDVTLNDVDTVVSDADGRFLFEDVDGPYRLTAFDADLGQHHVYDGLDRSSPVLHLINRVPVASSANVRGDLSGGAGFPNPDAHLTTVAFAAEDQVTLGSTVLFAAEGPRYPTVAATWYGDSVDGTVHALQWELNAALLPERFTGYGATDLSLTPGGVAADTDVALASVDTAFVAGEVELRGVGHTLRGKTAWIQWGAASSTQLLAELTEDETFTYAVPSLPYAIGVQAIAQDGSGNTTSHYLGGIAPQQIVELSLPGAPRLLGPPDGAALADLDQAFTFSPYEGGVHVATVLWDGGAVSLYTAADDFQLSQLGVDLPASTVFAWGVWGIAPAADLDTFASDGGGLPLVGGERELLLGTTNVRFFSSP